MIVKSLSKENIDEAIWLLHPIFVEDVRVGEAPSGALWASLEPQRNKEFFKKWNIKTIEYFVATDEKDGSLVGTTGRLVAILYVL